MTTGTRTVYVGALDAAIAAASHPDAVLSFLHSGQPWDDDVMATFCRYVLHFTGPATAQRWTAAHPGTFVISLGDGRACPPPHRPVLRYRTRMTGRGGPRIRRAGLRPAPAACLLFIARLGISGGECGDGL